MTRNTSLVALCSALPLAGDDGVPEWVHLLPAGDVRTVDGRGPYRVKALQSICDASIQPGKSLALDEAHATDKGAALGLAHPARGWIVEMEPRDNGIWGRVDWNKSGRALMEDRAYSGISPVIVHDKAGNVQKVLRASLTNTPNLEGLTALQSEEPGMDWRTLLILALGLDSDADDETVNTAFQAKMASGTPAPQSQQINVDHPAIVALQSQINTLASENAALKEGVARSAAEAFVDGAIAQGRVGVKPLRDEYISLHMRDAAQAEKLIGGMPVVGGRPSPSAAAPAAEAGELGADDRAVMALFGVSEEDYKAELAKGGQRKEVL